jgi:thiamine pyrophosphokinase
MLPSVEVFQAFADAPILAADGAADQLVGMGVVPEFVVGDMDSISMATLETIDGVAEMVVDTDQNSTDFEKVLQFSRDQLWHHILVLGIHGGDFEHTLNNWSVFMRHSRQQLLTALDRRRYAIPVLTSVRVELAPDELVSLIPQPSARLTTSGLRWPLTNEPLILGEREGARNRALDGAVHLEVHEGSLLLICDARLPLAPRFIGPSAS